MDRQQLLPLGEFELVEWLDDLDAGIADQNIEAAERCDRLRGCSLDLRLICYVDGNAERTPLPAAQLRRRRFGALLIEIGDRYFRALADEEARNLLADAASCSG